MGLVIKRQIKVEVEFTLDELVEPFHIESNHAKFQLNPFIVRILIAGIQFCGGSLISQKVIVSAAHCFSAMKITDFWVALGLHEAFNMTRDTKYEASSLIKHPHFNRTLLIHGK